MSPAWVPFPRVALGAPLAGDDRLCQSEPILNPPRIAASEIAVARQGPEREEFRIAVIVEIEHARKTAAGVMRLAPQPVTLLRGFQIIDAACHRRMIDLACRHQAQQRPGGL